MEGHSCLVNIPYEIISGLMKDWGGGGSMEYWKMTMRLDKVG